MATFGIESGSVDNRSFSSSTGLGKKFYDWITKTPSNHGPGWFIYDDQSTATTDPYIVVCNQSSPTANSKAVFIKVTVISATEQVFFAPYLAWNASTHVGLTQFQQLYVTTKTGAFAYYFRGGQDGIYVVTRDGTNIYSARLSRWTGVWDGAKGTEPETTSGVLINPAFLITDPGGYLSGFHNITGYKANLDAAGKLYFSIINDGGGNFHIAIHKDSARSLLIGTTSSVSSGTTGARTITQANSSGLGGTITINISVAAVTNIDCRFLRVDLGSGQGANFRVNKFYFLLDFSGGVQRISYVKVEAKSGDTLTLDYVGALPFSTGSYISPYPHRWVSAGNQSNAAGNAQIPYNSIQGRENIGYNDSAIVVTADYYTGVLTRLAPDDEGDFPGQYPLWYESTSGSFNGNRYWGKETNIVIGNGAGLAAFTDRRIFGGVPYICLTAGTLATLLLDQESLT